MNNVKCDMVWESREGGSGKFRAWRCSRMGKMERDAGLKYTESGHKIARLGHI